MSILVTTKIIGTAATGIWASYNLAVAASYEDVPYVPLVFAQGVAGDLKAAVQRSSALSAIGGAGALSFALSYLMSPRNGQHPYLLYVGIGASLIALLQYRGATNLAAQVAGAPQPAAEAAAESDDDEHSTLDNSIYEKVPAANKPAPKKQKQTAASTDLPVANKCTVFTRVVAGLSVCLYLVNLVGLAGDSF